ncbi:DUF6907 domain-containing protein [Nocardioides alcanivorans]|uniref:DUF6907 domain-containing protein n=1 Tax=Nocardioides alcanivorans TaxID=2897352 RepID=UPI001F230769|nr:hypothetical protein [Nocardioides alcanivorans]
MDDEQRVGIAGEACPPWCRSNHLEQDHPDDHYHDSAAAYVPVLLGRGTGQGQVEAVQTELLIVTSRKSGHHEDWLFIGEPDRPGQHLQLSRESARRLNVALTRHLEAISGDLT